MALERLELSVKRGQEAGIHVLRRDSQAREELCVVGGSFVSFQTKGTMEAGRKGQGLDRVWTLWFFFSFLLIVL